MAKFEHIVDVTESLCLRSGDILMRKKGLFLDCAQEVYNDLNLSVVKLPVRSIYEINKKTNTITLPPNTIKLSTVSLVDSCGHFIPIFRSDHVHDDLVDISAKKDCACEFKCGYQLCNTIKGYEAVKSVKSDYLPNGTPISFNCVDRKWVDSQGFLYERNEYPLRQYLSGVWASTVKYVEEKKLCQVEVDDNGCVCDTQENIDLICDACGFADSNIANVCVGGDAQSFNNDPSVKAWVYHVSSKMQWLATQCGTACFADNCANVYNVSEDGKRLIFPPHFAFSKVMVRTYQDVDLKDMYIAVAYKDVFMTGLQWWSLRHDLSKIKEEAVIGRRYANQKFALVGELNKYTEAAYRNMLFGQVFVPSYFPKRHHE